jgi:hypothetical protein
MQTQRTARSLYLFTLLCWSALLPAGAQTDAASPMPDLAKRGTETRTASVLFYGLGQYDAIGDDGVFMNGR